MSGDSKLFGTDGVRGTANVHPMTAELALSLGQAIAYVFRRSSRGGERQKIIIGKDTQTQWKASWTGCGWSSDASSISRLGSTS